jgi:hypothetical protein
MEEEAMIRGSITDLVPWAADLALTAAGCASQGSAEPARSVEGPAVAVRDYEFEPASLTVEAGAMVT